MSEQTAYSPEEVEERAADNEACVQPETHIRRWVATVRALREELRVAKAERERVYAELEEIAHVPSYPIDHRLAFYEAISRVTGLWDSMNGLPYTPLSRPDPSKKPTEQ